MISTPPLRRLLIISLLSASTVNGALVGSFAFDNIPIGATLSNPAANANGWLNVNATPLTFDEALTDLSVINSGWGNLAPDSVMEFRFRESRQVYNLLGPDLLILEARYDAGSYAVSVDFDGFTEELVVNPGDFVDSGERNSYHFGRSTIPPIEAGVFVAPIDLTALNVPEGARVQRVRVRTLDEMSDPLGLVALVPEPSATVLAFCGMGAFLLRRGRRPNQLPGLPALRSEL